MTNRARAGAVARGLSGKVYLGCNLEFRNLGLHHCIHAGLPFASRNCTLILPSGQRVLFADDCIEMMISEVTDRPRSFAEEFALISALNHGEAQLLQLAVSAAPCGYCRQLLAEAFLCACDCPSAAEPRDGPGLPRAQGAEGREARSKSSTQQFEIFIQPDPAPISLEALLPMAFGPRDLGAVNGLFSPQHHALVLSEDWNHGEAGKEETEAGVWEALAKKAVDCAARSYAPYSCSPSGVALLTDVRAHP